MQLKDIMTNHVITISPYQKIKDACMYMLEFDIGCVLVTDDSNVLLGIVTDRDITLAIGNGVGANEEIEKVMVRNPEFMTPEDEVGKAVSIMSLKQIRRLPIVNESFEVVGIVSLGDISKNEFSNEIAGLALTSISTQSSNQESTTNYFTDVDDFPL